MLFQLITAPSVVKHSSGWQCNRIDLSECLCWFTNEQ